MDLQSQGDSDIIRSANHRTSTNPSEPGSTNLSDISLLQFGALKIPVTTGVIILPTQTMRSYVRGITQNYHTFVLFDPQKNWVPFFMTPSYPIHTTSTITRSPHLICIKVRSSVRSRSAGGPKSVKENLLGTEDKPVKFNNEFTPETLP